MSAWSVLDEPVRGGYPPAGFFFLPGLEQVRAIAQGVVPRSPIMRLFGIRVTHASSGSATLTMPATPWHQTAGETIWLQPLVTLALNFGSRTVAEAETRGGLREVSISLFRIPVLPMNSFVARAKVISHGQARATTEVHVEDELGRLVMHATGQYVFVPRREGEVPARPLGPSAEATYETPDPIFRPLDDPPESGLGGARLINRIKERIATGDMSGNPVLQLTGIKFSSVAEGESSVSLKASEWFCNEGGTMFPIVAPLINSATVVAVATTSDDRLPVLNSFAFNFLGTRALPPDGRMIMARAKVVHLNELEVVADAEAIDADDQRVAIARSAATLIPRDAQESFADRVLTTVVFTDVVDSTPAVQKMGDAAWRDTLARVYASMRKELVNLRGDEVSTTGDGIVATFDSPARAVQFARGSRRSAQRMGLETRSGIHLGEVEKVGNDVSGIAVHIAKRVESAADPGSILVTSIVRDAVAGSGLKFAEHGTHELKGVDGSWRLFTVED